MRNMPVSDVIIIVAIALIILAAGFSLIIFNKRLDWLTAHLRRVKGIEFEKEQFARRVGPDLWRFWGTLMILFALVFLGAGVYVFIQSR